MGEKWDFKNHSKFTVKEYDLTTSAVPFVTLPVFKYWIH